MSISRRSFLRGAASAAALLPLAACGGAAAPAGSAAPASTAASAGVNASGKAAGSAAAASTAASAGVNASGSAAGSGAAASTAASAGASASGQPAASASVAASPASAARPSASAGAATIRLGVLNGASDAGFFIGLDKGWYAEQGIELQTTQFSSAAQMVAPLSAGQLDVGGGATSAGLNNAIAREIGIKMVADKGSVPANSSYEGLVVSKQLWDSGKFKDYQDLKGLKVAIASQAIASEVALDQALKKGGLTLKDVDVTFLGFPDMLAAMSGGSIQAAQPIEPFTTQIPAKGIGHLFARSNVYAPNDQTAVVLYGPAFAKDHPDLAKRFMVAYLRSLREYNDAFVKTPRDQKAYDEVVGILAKITTVKDQSLYAQMEMPGLNPDGKMIVQSMKDDQQWYIDHGFQKSAVDIDAGVDLSFADYAVQQLGGPYKA